MISLSRDNLKAFQLRAAGEMTQMLATYPAEPFKPKYNEDGQAMPFLCRLRAITGSGKTPMIALTAADLGDAIVLWTTNRGAIISQTATNLSAGGRYAALLPEDAQILEFGDLSEADWADVVTAKSGLTIVLATVALFNRDGDVLNAHKPRGDTTYWKMLGGQGPQARQRPLYVVYDEAHGGTAAQFARLTELDARAFILASSSDLPDELSHLLRGQTGEERSDSLQKQTVAVPTTEVVATGLLKTRLYLVDCNTTREDALKQANDKWFELASKLQPLKEWPVMCCIVNSTLAGLEVWETLTQQLKIDPLRVAVHLSSVEANKAEANPNVPWGQLIDTHKAKKSPEALRNDGYTHIIWNKSLREGWDEPWNYVAYLDKTGYSSTDISQKIGRFLRQPNAQPFDDGDLNSAYFYFNVTDKEFIDLLMATQNELEMEGYEVIFIGGDGPRPKTSREAPLKAARSIPKVAESFGDDLALLDQILIDNVPPFDTEDLRAPGRVTTRVLDLRVNAEDGSLHKEEHRDDNAEIRAYDYLLNRLSAIDRRIASRTGTCFSHLVKGHKRMRQKMQFGSPAMDTLNRNLKHITAALDNELRLVAEPDDKYELRAFNLVSPDLQTPDALKRERYRVHGFDNALHWEYNGFNPFEWEVAKALDSLGLEWCRNPSKTGYGIPIPQIGKGTAHFYPDFLLWKGKDIWAIDPKGDHLLTDAIFNKMMGVSDVEGLTLKIRVALVLDGNYALDAKDFPQKQGKDGATIIVRRNGQLKAIHRASPLQLVKELS